MRNPPTDSSRSSIGLLRPKTENVPASNALGERPAADRANANVIPAGYAGSSTSVDVDVDNSLA